MKKSIFVIFILLFFSQEGFSQIEYGYERSSKEPWKYGVVANGTYDWSTQNQGVTKKFGFKAGFVAEKHLIYNIYFQPALTLSKKGFESTVTNGYESKINGYFLSFDAAIQLKFGDERLNRGFLITLAPYFTYGLWGNSSQKGLNPINKDYNQTKTFNTFDILSHEDIGFVLGAGYDFNKHWEVVANYYFGLLKMYSYGNNQRWRGFNVGLEYYF